VVEAQVPLKEMFGCIGALRALSSGRASCTMQFHHSNTVSALVAAAITQG
jgi:elongation factor G